MNIVLAVSVFGVSFFICWGLFYFVMIARQMFRGVKEIRDRMNRVDEAVKAFKEKIESSASMLFLIGEGVKKMVDIMKSKGSEKNGDEDDERSEGKKHKN